MRQHATVLSICVDGMMRIESQYVELREHDSENGGDRSNRVAERGR
jgi:hypothetical protein